MTSPDRTTPESAPNNINSGPPPVTPGHPSTQPQHGMADQQSASPRRRTDQIGVCGGCEARWTGFRPAHCAACHITFSSPTAFDLHRRNIGERGACLDPHRVTGLEFRDGMWRLPEMPEAAKVARSG